MQGPDKLYFPQLDIYRFLAAIMVCIYHLYCATLDWWDYQEWMGVGKVCSPAFLFMDTFFKNLHIGVDVFFMISGFLITYILLKEKEKSGKINFKNFFIRRSLRIWPVYYLIIVLAPVLVKWMGEPHPDYLSNSLFIGNFSLIENKSWVFPFAHLWSVCIEEHFYLVWPFAIAFIPNKRLPLIFALTILSSIGFRAYVTMYGTDVWWHVYLNTLSRVDVLVMGAILAYVHHIHPITLGIHVGIRLLVYAAFFILLCNVNTSDFTGIWNACFKKYLYCGIVLFAIANAMFNKKPLLPFKRTNILHYLGKTSYGIYMYGNILVFVILHKLFSDKYATNRYVYVVVVIVITIAISALSYEFFEKWFLRFKRRFEIIKTDTTLNILGNPEN